MLTLMKGDKVVQTIQKSPNSYLLRLFRNHYFFGKKFLFRYTFYRSSLNGIEFGLQFFI